MASRADRDRSPSFVRPEDYGLTRAVLKQAGFTPETVCETLQVGNPLAISSVEPELLCYRTREDRPVDVLIRLFLMNVPVSVRLVQPLLGPAQLDAWAAAGLVSVEGDSVAAQLQLLPIGDLLVAFDPPQRPDARPTDYVPGIDGGSVALANLTVRRPSTSTLDLGTGCGFQALLAARHSTCVVAVDNNPRAVALAEFNARLNGLTNIECRQGDLFHAVEGRRFDLIVARPSFAMTAEGSSGDCDPTAHGDEICQAIVRQAAAMLAEGGYCQVLCDWAHRTGQPWRERLAGWLTGTGCDAWIMRTDTLEVSDYAAKRSQREPWLAHCRTQQIEAVSSGVITMRRRSGARPNWVQADDAPEQLLAVGDSVEQGFELRDLLESLSDPQGVLCRRFRVSPHASLQEQLSSPDTQSPGTDVHVQFERGLTSSGEMDLYVAGMLTRCDGRQTLGDLLMELAESLQQNPTRLVPPCTASVHRLVEQGLLLPVEEAA